MLADLSSKSYRVIERKSEVLMTAIVFQNYNDKQKISTIGRDTEKDRNSNNEIR